MMRALFRSTKLAVLFAMFFSLFPAVHVAGVFEPAHPGPDIHPDTSTVDKPDDLILAVPAFFVPNLGQMSPDVLFYAQGSGASFASNHKLLSWQ